MRLSKPSRVGNCHSRFGLVLVLRPARTDNAIPDSQDGLVGSHEEALFLFHHAHNTQEMNATMVTTVLDFWFQGSLQDWDRGPDAPFGRHNFWWHGGPKLDAEVKAKFSDVLRDVAASPMTPTVTSNQRRREIAEAVLAQIIVLSQFSRHTLPRGELDNPGTCDEYDASARKLASWLISEGLWKQELAYWERAFAYMPFIQSEVPHDYPSMCIAFVIRWELVPRILTFALTRRNWRIKITLCSWLQTTTILPSQKVHPNLFVTTLSRTLNPHPNPNANPNANANANLTLTLTLQVEGALAVSHQGWDGAKPAEMSWRGSDDCPFATSSWVECQLRQNSRIFARGVVQARDNANQGTARAGTLDPSCAVPYNRCC